MSVDVDVHSGDILVYSADCKITPMVFEHTNGLVFAVDNLAHFLHLNLFTTSFVSPDIHYCWVQVDRGSLE